MPKSPRRSTWPASRPTPVPHHLNPKRRGELAELAFILKAARLGFGVSKPFGDSERYDAIIDARELEQPGKHPCNPHCPVLHPPKKNRKRKKVPLKADAGARDKSGCPTLRDVRKLRTTEPDNHTVREGESRKTTTPYPRENCPALRTTGKPQPKPDHCPGDPTAPLWRVQVKCTDHLLENFYHLLAQRRVAGRAIPYLPGEIDFLAAYIVPEDTWYIIPLAAFLGYSTLLFRRHDDPKPGTYDEYKEAWHLLRRSAPGR